MTHAIALECGTLIDGGGDDPIEDALVLVEEGRVIEAGAREEVAVPGGAERIDHRGETVIPGLIDAHCHLGGWRSADPTDWMTLDRARGAARATADCRALLEAGFTSVRELGSRTGLGLRDAVADGDVPGPRIRSSGLGISQTGGFSDPGHLPVEWTEGRGNGISTFADGPDACRREARKRIREGADAIKIWTSGGTFSEAHPPDRTEFTGAEVRAVVEEAHRAGIRVASHAQGAEGILLALENGVDTIEHGSHLDAACIEAMRERDATLVATLSLIRRYATLGEEHGVDPEVVDRSREVLEARVEAARRAHEAGVPVALGTDLCGPDLIPHGENALEAELLVEAVGMDELEAIEAGTRVAARTLPDDDLGVIAPGYRADLTALDGDPTDDISALREVAAVYTGGARVA